MAVTAGLKAKTAVKKLDYDLETMKEEEEETETETESEEDAPIVELFPTYIYTGLSKRGREPDKADRAADEADGAGEAGDQKQLRRPRVRPRYIPGM